MLDMMNLMRILINPKTCSSSGINSTTNNVNIDKSWTLKQVIKFIIHLMMFGRVK